MKMRLLAFVCGWSFLLLGAFEASAQVTKLENTLWQSNQNMNFKDVIYSIDFPAGEVSNVTISLESVLHRIVIQKNGGHKVHLKVISEPKSLPPKEDGLYQVQVTNNHRFYDLSYLMASKITSSRQFAGNESCVLYYDSDNYPVYGSRYVEGHVDAIEHNHTLQLKDSGSVPAAVPGAVINGQTHETQKIYTVTEACR